jgi:hypothetical protein
VVTFVPATNRGGPWLVLHHCGHLVERSVRGEEIAGRLLQHSPQIFLSLLPSDGRRTLRAGNEIKPVLIMINSPFAWPSFLFPFLGPQICIYLFHLFICVNLFLHIAS